VISIACWVMFPHWPKVIDWSGFASGVVVLDCDVSVIVVAVVVGVGVGVVVFTVGVVGDLSDVTLVSVFEVDVVFKNVAPSEFTAKQARRATKIKPGPLILRCTMSQCLLLFPLFKYDE